MVELESVREALEDMMSGEDYFNKVQVSIRALFPPKDTYSFTPVNGDEEFFLQRHPSRWRALFRKEVPVRVGRITYDDGLEFERMGANGNLEGKDFPVFRKVDGLCSEVSDWIELYPEPDKVYYSYHSVPEAHDFI